VSKDNWRDEGHDGWGGESDPLAPARGCIVGIALGAAIWILGYVIYRVVTS
jgi:hypothetical protein